MATRARRRPPRLAWGRFGVTAVVSALSLQLMAWILPGLELSDWIAGVGAVAVIAALNALVWPMVARYAAGVILLSVGILGLVANGLLIMLAAALVEGFDVSNLGTAILASLGMTTVSAVLGNLLSLDDDEVWRRQVTYRLVQKVDRPDPTDEPGILFLQIDGLSEPILRRAMTEGYMPTLASWLRSGTHRIARWECDLSSQTGASQAGILHGNNGDMPAFRWYDKTEGRIFTSNRPRDAAAIEAQRSDGRGLLANGGVSRSNVFSGDSDDSILTFSTVTNSSRHRTRGFSFFMAHPHAISRLLVLSIADIGRELAAARRARRRRVEPRLQRGGIYPLLRAATTVMLRDLTVYTLVSDVYRGVPAAYVDFVGYDEVAHHSGIAAHDALETLYRLDQQLARVRRAIDEAPRPYHVVVLSDHGQTQGATFLQRYGTSLSSLVADLSGGEGTIDAPTLSSEGWGNLNGLFTDAVNDEESRLSGLIRVLVRARTVDGQVVLGPGDEADGPPGAEGDAVVLASGNLGLISFPSIAGRASFETIMARYPRLIPGLAQHHGIGFVLVGSERLGSMVIGRSGITYLRDGLVEGDDPLAPFGPRAIDHVRRTDSFTNVPDLLVNSFYDPETDEGAAFEELIGFHGGLGGKQTEPFLMFPTVFPLGDEPVVGAETVHEVLSRWLGLVADDAVAAPWSVPDRPEAPMILPGTRR